MASKITLRAPSTSAAAAATTTTFTAPDTSWIYGTWHVTHSTLPIWRTKRDVQITYTPILPSSPSTAPQETTAAVMIDDLVSYRDLGDDNKSGRVKTVRGVDKPSTTVPAAWDWRGRGWLMVASSHWEILGYGEEEEGEEEGDSPGQWAVTYFAKTLFTPAGIDIYSRASGGLREETVDSIKAALCQLGDKDVSGLVEKMFAVAL